MTEWAWWPHTTDTRVASYRLRCLQIVGALQSCGCNADLYRRDAPPPKALVLSKRYDEHTLEAAWRMRVSNGTRLVLDLCDNHFQFTHETKDGLARRATLLRQACSSVDLVVSASEALAKAISHHVPSARVAVIPDAAEPPLYPPSRTLLHHPVAAWKLLNLKASLASVPLPRRLVWFGNHGSPGVDGGLRDLDSLRSQLEAVHEDAPLSLTVISNNKTAYQDSIAHWQIRSSYLPWHAATFSSALRLHSAAVIPIRVNAFTECKTANRVLSATLHGLNVIADAIPSYEPFQNSIVLDNWDDGLKAFLIDKRRRREMWRCAAEISRRDYSLERIAEQWKTRLSALVNSSPREPS